MQCDIVFPMDLVLEHTIQYLFHAAILYFFNPVTRVAQEVMLWRPTPHTVSNVDMIRAQ